MLFIKEIFEALNKMPKAVFLWVMILFSVNLIEIPLMFIPPLPIVTATLIAAILGMGPNIVMLWVWRGFSRIMGLPHLLPWVSLNIYLLLWLLTDELGPQLTMAGGSFLVSWAWIVVVCNSISLSFDFVDVWRWWQGDREIVRGDSAHMRLVAKY